MKQILPLLIIILFLGCNQQSEVAELQSEKAALVAERDSLIESQHELEETIDSLRRRNKQLQKASDVWFGKQTDGREFVEMGIENPEKYITNALRQKPELIPAEPVLGGQMQFRHIKLLGKDCLIAYYEDGHINGKALYSYKLGSGGLEFKLIRTCPE